MSEQYSMPDEMWSFYVAPLEEHLNSLAAEANEFQTATSLPKA